MPLFRFRFFPVLLPLLIYLLWLYIIRKRAHKAGEPLPRFQDGPLFWVVMASLGIALLCFVALGISSSGHKGSYQPAHMEGDKIIPPEVKQ